MSDRPGGHGGEPLPGQSHAAPTAAELAIGRHERGDGGGEPVAGAVPPWQRISAQPGSGQPGSAQPGSPDPAHTTEVRMASGVATASSGLAGPAGSGPAGSGGPTEHPTVQTRAEPPGGQGAANGLASPFGGSAGPADSTATAHIDQQNLGQPPPVNRSAARPNVQSRVRPARAPRKASLQIRRIDPWSVLKLSLVLSVAMFLMWLVAVGVLYGVLNGMGVWDKLNGAWDDLASVNESGSGEQLISAGRVFGVSAVLGAVNVVLFTAFATVLAFVYNVSADMAGGIEVTLSERD